jgi:UDP-glucose 4-epimerase
MAKVLVTGGAGFIGSHLCERLVARGDDVVILDDLSSGTRSNIQSLEGRVHFIEDRVQNVEAHRRELEGVTRIFHLAALISGYDSLSDPEAYTNANIVGTSRLLQVAKGLGKVRIVFASSSTVYGNRNKPTQREVDTVNPITMYALSKLTCEQMLAMYQPLFGYDYACLRLFNVYGPRQNPDHPYANVTCKFAHAAAEGRPVRLYGDGEQSRDFIYVDDVVTAFLLSCEPTPQRIYNVGTGEEHSIRHLLNEVQRLSGRRLKVECHPAWPNDIRSIRADISRAAADLGFVARVRLSVGLARTIRHFEAARGRAQPHGPVLRSAS